MLTSRLVKKIVIVALHAAYWLMYLLLLLAIVGMAIGVKGRNPGLPGAFRFVLNPSLFWVSIAPGVVAFYVFYFWIFDRWLRRKKLLGLMGMGLLVSVGIALLALVGLYTWPPGRRVLNFGEMLSIFLATLIPLLVHGVIALIVRGFVSWYREIHWKDKLLQRNDEMEMALIKSQLNPHFLFNTLNNIDVLVGRNPQQASLYLNKLSEILRFMLYETKEEDIPLTKELDYIHRYIDLQRIRVGDSDQLQYVIRGDAGGWMVAPMLFMPFIENAFKHSAGARSPFIRMEVVVDREKLYFRCTNSRAQAGRGMAADHQGLGQDLIRKRLKLLYPDRHLLEVGETENDYTVELTLYADEMRNNRR